MPPLEAAAAPATGAAARRKRERIGATAGSHWRLSVYAAAAPAGQSAPTGLERLTPSTAAAGSTRLTPSARAAWLLAHEQKRPLVVMVPAEVQADRLALALAADPHHAAGNGPADKGAALRRGGAGHSVRQHAASGATADASLDALYGLAGSAGQSRLPGLTQRAARTDVVELVVGDRILEFLPEIVPLHQQIDARRQTLSLRLAQADGAHVLLPAPHELRLFLPLSVVGPHGERNRHQYGHHSHGDTPCGHRVTAFSPETASRLSGPLSPAS